MEKKCILVGVTGGIAAYKACALVSHLKKMGHDVHVLMSEGAMKFVSPLTFQSLSNNRVITDMFAIDFQPEVHHISLAKRADVFVVAPATADFIAKAANGIADDMLTTTFLAAYCKKLVVPAMNTHMLENPATQRNIETLRKDGIAIMESDAGYLACGDVGKGRMPDPENIIDAMGPLLYQGRSLKGMKVLVSAGATQEEIDPVRYITNHSTGKMGYALARAARDAGADVTLVSGKTYLDVPYGVKFVSVTSAKEMAEVIINMQNDVQAIIMSAAVADYTPKNKATEKIKKAEGNMHLALERTQDILFTLAQNKKPGQIVIGFAMETENLLENARKKLSAKNADYIIANSIRDEGAGFGVDTNKITIISSSSEQSFDRMSKYEAAQMIIKVCLGGKYAVGH